MWEKVLVAGRVGVVVVVGVAVAALTLLTGGLAAMAAGVVVMVVTGHDDLATCGWAHLLVGVVWVSIWAGVGGATAAAIRLWSSHPLNARRAPPPPGPPAAPR